MPVPAPCPQGWTAEGACRRRRRRRGRLPLLPGFGGRPDGPAAPPASGDGVVTGVRWPRLLPRGPRRSVISPPPTDAVIFSPDVGILCHQRGVGRLSSGDGCGRGPGFSARACGGPSRALGRRPTPGSRLRLHERRCAPAVVYPRRPGGPRPTPPVYSTRGWRAGEKEKWGTEGDAGSCHCARSCDPPPPPRRRTGTRGAVMAAGPRGRACGGRPFPGGVRSPARRACVARPDAKGPPVAVLVAPTYPGGSLPVSRSMW